MLGQLIGNYVVEAKVGEGGMGTVYRARHPRLGKSVASKFLRRNRLDDPTNVARFFNEARAAHQIGSEHIVEVLDFAELADGTPYYVMEWLDGQSLESLLNRLGSLPLPRALHIV